MLRILLLNRVGRFSFFFSTPPRRRRHRKGSESQSTKVQNASRLLGMVRQNPISTTDGKAVLAFILPKGDTEGSDAAALRMHIHEGEKRSAEIKTALRKIIVPMSVLPALAKASFAAEVRAKLCEQQFPHPLK